MATNPNDTLDSYTTGNAGSALDFSLPGYNAQVAAPQAQPVRFSHLRQHLASYPWAMEERAFLAMVELLEVRFSGAHLSREEIDERVAAGRKKRRPAKAAGGVAVIPLTGTLVQRSGGMNDVSGMRSTTEFAAEVEAASHDPEVGSIVYDIDSPGGSVFGLQEAAAVMRDARTRKFTVAVANSWAASAAYHLASQATEVVAAPGSELGSIGVYAMHQDVSAAAESQGVKVSYVSSAPFKTEGNPYEALSKEAREALQESVDEHHNAFIRDISEGRGIAQKRVESDFGQGRMLTARKAVEVGMADRIATLREVVTELAGRSTAPKRSGRSAAQLRAAVAAQRLAVR